MSDAYFDAMRDAGTYPRKGYGWCSEESQRAEITRYLEKGYTPPWVLKEAHRFGLDPAKYSFSTTGQRVE